LTLECGFVKTGGPNLDSRKYSRQGDRREAHNRRRRACCRRTAARTQ